MKCKRCRKAFDTSIAELNAEQFGHNICACPHCGKAYRVRREIKIVAEEIDDITLGERKTDDWGDKIIPDKKYKQN